MNNQRVELQRVVDFLKKLAGENDMASLQISSEGHFRLMIGPTHEEHGDIDQFCHTFKDYKIPEARYSLEDEE